jgi:hypothetical protein
MGIREHMVAVHWLCGLKAWVCSPLLAGIVDLNTVEGMDVSCCQVEILVTG